jgi:hypothetical protein
LRAAGREEAPAANCRPFCPPPTPSAPPSTTHQPNPPSPDSVSRYSCLLFDCGLEFSRSKPGEGKGPGLVKKRSSTQTFFETQTPMENEPGNLTNKDTGLL